MITIFGNFVKIFPQRSHRPISNQLTKTWYPISFASKRKHTKYTTHRVTTKVNVTTNLHAYRTNDIIICSKPFLFAPLSRPCLFLDADVCVTRPRVYSVGLLLCLLRHTILISKFFFYSLIYSPLLYDKGSLT